ncbi:MAG: DUF288 domain-containing protein [Bacteroidetes bacterium]|jgi:hypothetical protein|nr:DUF288 domain-containing protein [Bacteroidota bacterium]
MNTPVTAVITTIQAPTPAVRALHDVLQQTDGRLVVIGDAKGPPHFDLEGVQFVPLDAQQALPFTLADRLPTGHYARKNLGYLLAMQQGAACIYETDDDNAPNATWQPRAQKVKAEAVAPRPWCNVFRLFTDEHIWPRGFPLDQIRNPATYAHEDAPLRAVESPIQQGLADGSPDVDAVWRLTLDRDVRFDRRPSVWLPPGTWCPFNSQSTWWWPPAWPLMYLPSHCTFRMTDIWRSFVAQRCLWAMEQGVVFHASEVVQERNEHDLMRDFEDEVPGYLHNVGITEILEGLDLDAAPHAAADNLRACYDALIAAGRFPDAERPLVDAWCRDVRSLMRSTSSSPPTS